MSAPSLSPGARARAAAARVVASWLKTGAFPDHLLDGVREQRALVTELTHGVVRHFRALDWALGRLVRRRPREDLAALLLVGLHQTLYMPGLAEHAAVYETVAATRGPGGAGASGLVNAVLRRALRERERLRGELAACPPGVRLSHPDLLLDRWSVRYERGPAEAICEWNNQIPPIVLRVNRLLTTAERFGALLRQAGLDAAPHPADPARFLVAPHGRPIADIPGYAEGLFAVQDPATAAATDLLDARPGDCLLDACAAPGGKTFLLAEALRGEGALAAMDSSADRVLRLKENRDRLRAPWVDILEGRADERTEMRRLAAERTAGRGGFDGILLDAPCTNTGVIRRRPDARWRFSEARLREACRRQAALLDGTAGALRPGGRLVYSTCSLEPEENEQQVAEWLKRHGEFTLKAERRLVPPDSGTDGAYAALLIRHEASR